MTSPYGPGAGDAGSWLTQQLNGVGGSGSGTAYVDPSEPIVGLTRRVVSRGKPMPDGQRLPGRAIDHRDQLPLSQAQASIYSWNEDEWKSLAKRLWYLGYDGVSDPTDIQGAIKVWQSAVAEAAKMQSGGHDMSPDDVLNLYAASNQGTAAKRASGDLQSSKSRQISLTDPAQAKALVTQAFQQAMGRDPTDAEVRVLTASLHQAERDNPAVSETKPVFDNNGNPIPGATETVNQGGVDPSAFIQQAAQADPEAAEYQAGTFYFNALMKALQSPE